MNLFVLLTIFIATFTSASSSVDSLATEEATDTTNLLPDKIDPTEAPCVIPICPEGCDLVGLDDRGCGGDCMCSTRALNDTIITPEAHVEGVYNENKDEVCAAFAKAFNGTIISSTLSFKGMFAAMMEFFNQFNSLAMEIEVPDALHAKKQFDDQSFMAMLELPDGVTMHAFYFETQESSHSVVLEVFLGILFMIIVLCTCSGVIVFPELYGDSCPVDAAAFC